MDAVYLDEGVYRLSADIGSRDLFEGIWPIPYGVSLNVYAVKGKKTALIDMVKDWDGAPDRIKEQLASINIELKQVDYIVLNHMEPDHTGWLREVHRENPNLEFVVSKKSVPLLKNFYGITEKVRAVGSGDSLDLGMGKVLVFEDTPNVHWPETIMTYEKSSGTLFSCDAFGSFGKLGALVFDDQCLPEDCDFFEKETERYYANIVSTFSPFVIKAIEKASNLDIKVIAPSHGLVWRKDPQAIIEKYKKLASYHKGPAEKEITLVWSSMYGNTAALVEPIVEAIKKENVPLHIHRVPQEHVSFVLSSAWRSAGIVIGTPTYEYRMFPPMAHVLDIFDRSHVTDRKVLRFGSYGWSGGAQKQFDQFNTTLKWECLDPIEYAGAPDDEDITKAKSQAAELAKQIKAL